jgi:uncharacterized repeat protein (TIGR03943 family)
MDDSHIHEHDHACHCHSDRAGRGSALAEAVVLAILAGFLAHASLSGRVEVFLAPMYVWLPPTAALLLAMMAVARLGAVVHWAGGNCDCDCSSATSPVRWLFCSALVVAVVAALAIDPQQFSTDCVRKRSSPQGFRDRRLELAMAWALGRTTQRVKEPGTNDRLPAEPTLLELIRSEETGQGAGWEGRFVTVIGQCDPIADSKGTRFSMYRFVVTCCIADAQAVVIEVACPQAAAVGSRQWVRVGGIVHVEGADSGGRLVIHAATVTKIPVPATPYL